MRDCLDRPIEVGDHILMYSEYQGRQMVVKITKFNANTNKMSVERLDEDISKYERREFSTNYWPQKLYKLVYGDYIGNGKFLI